MLARWLELALNFERETRCDAAPRRANIDEGFELGGEEVADEAAFRLLVLAAVDGLSGEGVAVVGLISTTRDDSAV